MITELHIWDKEKIRNLTNQEKEMWFDVYNHGLEEDRGYQLEDPNILLIQENIKIEYFAFLKEFVRTPYFASYYILVSQGKMVSLCRVYAKENVYYLEGLQTHRDEFRKHYASTLLKKVIEDLKEKDVLTLRSVVSTDNDASIQLHNRLGFKTYDSNTHKIKFEYTIMQSIRYPRHMYRPIGWLLFFGVPYHVDNNKRFYKSQLNWLKVDLIFIVLIGNIVVIYLLNNSEKLSLGLIILFHLCLWIYSNFMNFVRWMRYRDDKDEKLVNFRRILKNYTVFNTLFLILASLIVSFIYIFMQ